MSGVPSGGDRLAAFQQNIDQADGPVIVIGAGFAQVILDIAEAARAQAEREPGALDTAIRSALARLDSGAAEENT